MKKKQRPHLDREVGELVGLLRRTDDDDDDDEKPIFHESNFSVEKKTPSPVCRFCCLLRGVNV